MLSNIYLKVSEELGIDKETISKVYNNYWLFIKTKIEEMPMKDNLSIEELNNMKLSFNIPFIGKLGVDKNKYLRKKKLYKNLTDESN